MNRCARLTLAGLLSLPAICGAQPAPADTAIEQILAFHSDILVHADASMTVRETIHVRSTGAHIRHGIYRDFPTRYRDADGRRHVVGFDVVGVERDGHAEEYREARNGSAERIYFGRADVALPAGDHTYTLTYAVTRELGFFADHDELYWNVTGVEWSFPILEATASVRLPAGVPAGSIRLDGYTGRFGDRGRAFAIAPGDHGADFRTTQPLAAGEGLTLVVSWPRGYVREPGRADRVRAFITDYRTELAGAAGLVLVLAYYLVVWARIGRDPSGSSIVATYEPPAGISPSTMRYLRRMAFDDKAVVAGIVNMAVKRVLAIRQSKGIFRLVPMDASWDALAPEERAAAEALFGEDGSGGSARKPVSLRPDCERLRQATRAVRKSLRTACDGVYVVAHRRYFVPGLALSVVAAGAVPLALGGADGAVVGALLLWLGGWTAAVVFLVRSAVKEWRGARAGGSVGRDLSAAARSMTFMALVFGIFEVLAVVFLASETSWALATILGALVIANVSFHRLLAARTAAGRQLLDRIEGFRMFLNAVDADRLDRLTPPAMTPALFEAYLPYAIALDAEVAWARQFAAVLDRARESTGYSPAWYAGGRGWTADAFASSLSGSLGSAMAAAAAPGSRSGAGDGGFSGGGGGGGGGGGW